MYKAKTKKFVEKQNLRDWTRPSLFLGIPGFGEQDDGIHLTPTSFATFPVFFVRSYSVSGVPSLVGVSQEASFLFLLLLERISLPQKSTN